MLTLGLSLDLRAKSIVTGPHVVVKLISDHQSISYGGSARVGVLFEPEDGWHVYWENPGDTGLKPNIVWELSSSLSIAELRWPFPESIKVAHLTNFGFHDDVLLSTDISHRHLAESSRVKKNLSIAAKISWLVCKETCVPGSANLKLEIPAGKQAIIDTDHQPLFEKAEALLPKPLQALSKSATLNTNSLTIDLFAQSLIFKHAEDIQIFVKNLDLVHYGKPVEISWANNRLHWKQKLNDFFQKAPKTLTIVIVVDKLHAYQLQIPIVLANHNA